MANEVRSRNVTNFWVRNPNGIPIQTPPPYGIRTPNGHVWANSVDEFYWVQRDPKIPGYMGLASRSMMDQFGENYRGVNGKANPNSPPPRVVEPHPVLCVIGETGDPGVKGLSLDEKLKTRPKPDPSRRMDTSAKEPFDDFSDKMSTISFAMSVEDRQVVEAPAESSDKEKVADKGKSQDEATNPLEQGAKEAATKVHCQVHEFEDIPKLEEFIPEYYYPDMLLVYDPYDLSKGTHSRTKNTENVPPNCYKRVWPVFEDDSKYVDNPRIAHMWLDRSSLLGVGHHSYVYRAPLQLPAPLKSTHQSGKVTVAAKLAMPRQSARDLLANEARIYHQMPKDMQETWSGLNVIMPIRYPVPVGALAPKFFGWYKPVEEDGTTSVETRSPILLLEECGEPIEPADFTVDQRTECFSMFLRLHAADMLQNSSYTRNIMRQPGPLHLPHSERSDDTPSFRIIDFGRAETFEDLHKQAEVEYENDCKKKVSQLDMKEQDEFYQRLSWKMAKEKMFTEQSIHKELGYNHEYNY